VSLLFDHLKAKTELEGTESGGE